jgi:transglutaminase-like putative cysteine protease
MRRFRVPVLLLLLPCATAPVVAQTAAPVLPSQASDSIVRLAVDPARAGGRGVVVLLDESTLRVEADGRWTQQLRQVVQVLDANTAAQVAERALGYARDHQTLRVQWTRVLRTDGRVVSDRPAQDQEGDLAAPMNNPIYTDQRVRRLSMAGVSAGVIVDLAYSLEERAARRPGDFFMQWGLNGPIPIRRSQLVVDVPVGYEPRIVEHSLIARRQEPVVGDRRRFIWRSVDQEPLPAEAFAPDTNELQQTIVVSAPGSWSDLARWYDDLARSRYTLSPSAQRAADSVIAATRPTTRADSVRAWHRWIAQDIRYLSVALGLGSYQPRTADEVLSSGAGDCKDKATLFIAVLRRAGIEAQPVLLNLAGRMIEGAPSVSQFNHAIAAVREGAAWTYTDLTANALAYGELPPSYQGGRALRLTASGEGELVSLPASRADATTASLQLVYRLDTAGVAVGTGRERAAGPSAMGTRSIFAVPLDDTRRAAITRQIAQTVIGTDGGVDARVDSLVGFDGRDLTVAPDVRYALRVTNAVRRVGSTRLLAIPLAMRGPARQFRSAVRELESAGPRRLPIDGARILPSLTTVLEWRVTLPEGWTVELPPPVDTRSFFGQYESRWTLRGRELVLARRLTGLRGVVGPERMIEVLVWLRTVGADEQEFLTMTPVAAPRAPEGAR